MEVEGEEKEGLYGITRERSTYKIVPADLTGNSSLHFYHVRSTGKSQPTAKKLSVCSPNKYHSYKDGSTFRNFSKKVEGRTGHLTILHTLTIAGECSANDPRK